MAGQVFPIRRDLTTIGREPGCEIVLDNTHISKQHAELVIRDRKVFLRDAGSTNGTFLNGEQVHDGRQVRLGDLVGLGEVSARITIDDRDGEPREPARLDPLPDPDQDLAMATDIAWADDAPAWADDDDHSAGLDTWAEGGSTTPAVLSSDAIRPDSGNLGIAIPEDLAAAPKSKTILVSHARADRSQAELVVRFLQKKGHKAWIDRSAKGDGWSGRLLDVMWSCDAAVFVVSPDAAGSARVHREIHLAGSERVPVLPVTVAPTELPVDLGHYVTRQPAIDLVDDPLAGLDQLGARIDDLPRRLVARPKLRAVQVALIAALVVAIWFGLRFVGAL